MFSVHSAKSISLLTILQGPCFAAVLNPAIVGWHWMLGVDSVTGFRKAHASVLILHQKLGTSSAGLLYWRSLGYRIASLAKRSAR